VQDEFITWISANVLPYEAEVRRWLRRARVGKSDEDDLIQEAYCRIVGVGDASRIRSGRAYFFSVVRNLLIEDIRRSRVVHIEAMAEIEDLSIPGSEPTPERSFSGRQQLAVVQRLIEELPERCRAVFKLRKIEVLSQRETAERLGLTENVVEKQLAIGLRTVLRRLAESDRGQAEVLSSDDGQGRQRRDRKGRRGLGRPAGPR
jgi:RNA polymerase sigma-70 factor (ECF subfamily)